MPTRERLCARGELQAGRQDLDRVTPPDEHMAGRAFAREVGARSLKTTRNYRQVH
jgi:hypothetical protein